MSAQSEFCFVVMPFAKELDDVYESVKEAVEETGLICIRSDEEEGTGNIVRKIVERIAEAKMVIVDLTLQRVNVFYELGIAHSLGNNVLVIAQDVESNVPFNIINYQVQEYANSMAGGTALRKAIKQAIEHLPDWSQRTSNPVQDFLPESSRTVPAHKYAQAIGAHSAAAEEVENLTKKLIRNSRHEANAKSLKKKLQASNEKCKHLMQYFKDNDMQEELEQLLKNITPPDDKSERTTFKQVK